MSAQSELIRLGRYPLLVVDEVDYIPFEAEAASLFFQLVLSRYERASLIVTPTKPSAGGANSSATTSSPVNFQPAPRGQFWNGVDSESRKRLVLQI